MKIIHWNLKRTLSVNAFKYALDKFSADFYFFQECLQPSRYLTSTEFRNIKDKFVWEKSAEASWGNFIFSKKLPLKKIDIKNPYRGRIAVGKVKIGSRTIHLINLHAPVIKGKSEPYFKEMLSYLRHLTNRKSCIITGDLNTGVYFDNEKSTWVRDFFGKTFSEHNIVSCYHKFHKKEKTTFWSTVPSKKKVKCMIDYIFVTKDLERYVSTCDVKSGLSIRKLSDHNPLVMNINLK